MPDRRIELDRFTAAPMVMASSLSAWERFSVSELEAEELELSTKISGPPPFDVIGVMDRRLDVLLGSSSLRGDPSLSDEESRVNVGGSIRDVYGEPSYFLDKNPAWNRLFLDCTSSVGSGGGGTGEESGDWVRS